MNDWLPIGTPCKHGTLVLAYGRSDKGCWYVRGYYRTGKAPGIMEVGRVAPLHKTLPEDAFPQILHPLRHFTFYMMLEEPRGTM